MTEQEYIKNRLENQINWYDKKSVINKRYYKQLKTLEILLAISIPILTLIFESQNLNNKTGLAIFGIIGILITAVASLISFGKYQENWQAYRTTCESLKKERILFQTKARPYNDEGGFNLLVERVESLISKENTNWSQIISSKENKHFSATK